MPDYSYKAADSRGAIIKGIYFANNGQELANYLKSAGLHLIEFKEAKARQFLKLFEDIQIGGVSRRELVEFSNNMGVMFKAGIPLVQSFNELREDTENRYFKKALGEIINDIEAGDTLYEAMGKKPRIFPELYIRVIQIGENTGRMDSAFFDLARHFKRIDDLVKNVRKALIYPSFVVLALIGASFVFLTMVFPPLFSMLTDFDVPLPTITKVVMAVSNTLKDHGLIVLLCIIVFGVLFIGLRRYKNIKYYMDWFELHIPYIKSLLMQLRMSFFMRYFAMLLSAGMDILRSLELASASVNNLVVHEFLTSSRERVIEGEFLSDSLRNKRFVPHMVARMVAIGEESGNLPEQMEYVADYYDEELQRRITIALALMEPILLVIMAGLALALIMGVLLPLYNLVSQLSAGAGGGGM